jgi:predicted ATPase
MTQGPGSPETSEAYERALVLCEQFEEGPAHFTALWNLWFVNTARAEYDKAKELSGELLSLAPKLQESDYFLQAGHSAWTTNFTRGELLVTAKHTDHGRDIYDRQAHAAHAFSYGGHDPGVCCNAISALTYWLLGYPDKSLAAARGAIDLAGELDHPFSSCQASVYGAFAYQFRGHEREVETHGSKGIATASENGFPSWLGWGSVAGSVGVPWRPPGLMSGKAGTKMKLTTCGGALSSCGPLVLTILCRICCPCWRMHTGFWMNPRKDWRSRSRL